MKTVKVTLSRSLIGRLPNQVKTANSLGLFKMHDTKVLKLDDAVLGKLNTIKHLVTVLEGGEDVK